MEQISQAYISLQNDLKPISKDGKGNWGKYATLAHVLDSISEPMAKHGLAVTQPLSNLNGEPAIRTILLHTSGEYIEDVTPLILPKNDPQTHGSAITYARRYGLCSILGLAVDGDDDGQSATDKMQSPQTSRQTYSQPVQNNVDNVDAETFKELCFLPNNLGLDKDQAKKVWDYAWEIGRYTRGKYDPAAKSWTGTNVPNDALRPILTAFAKEAGQDPNVLLAQFGIDALSDIKSVEDYSDAPF